MLSSGVVKTHWFAIEGGSSPLCDWSLQTEFHNNMVKKKKLLELTASSLIYSPCVYNK